MKRLLVTFFCTGYAPWAPGTLAALAATALAWLLYRWNEQPWPLVALAASATCAGLGLGRWAISHFRNEDPGQFVLDEAAGQLLACAAATPLIPAPWPLEFRLATAFVLFRFFDIVKPPPIRQAERLPAGWGIMADDLLAGIVSGALLLGAEAVANSL
jgi:phosphatidylglycerophosphatase A